VSTPSNEHQPYIPPNQSPPELTLSAVVAGALLGLVFGASSLYLVLKVGLTVSASIPVAVLSITFFRGLSRVFGFRPATILENNITQTTGSAGESLAFGVGVTMPALLLLGYEMDILRVMTVGILGGLLGILMMIPLRRAFIVKQHGKLVYPEGTACAEVLVAGEKGGGTAAMVFLGFGVAFFYKLLADLGKLWSLTPSVPLSATSATGKTVGLKNGVLGGELSPELLGVGYLIGPRVASIMVAGGVLSYLVLVPMISTFGANATEIIPPAKAIPGETSGVISDMKASHLRDAYVIYIGAGAVTAGGIISMLKALPLIFASIASGLRDLRGGSGGSSTRTDRDLPLNLVLFGCLGLVLALMLTPSLGLGLGLQGAMGAGMILLFGFLFVTVSSRLTGEIGSSSNPISGMTVATILLTCLIFWAAGKTDTTAQLTALTVAAVVCIASSNGGTTSQDLKTGYLVGATPHKQQIGIVIGALTSAVVIGGTLLALNSAGTVYTRDVPNRPIPNAATYPIQEFVGKPYNGVDPTLYYVVHVRPGDFPAERGLPEIPAGRYLVHGDGKIYYRADPAIRGTLKKFDKEQPEWGNLQPRKEYAGEEVPERFEPPQPELFSSIIRGILGGTLEWGLMLIGIMIALVLELAGVASLPFAVGMYIPLAASTPIFVGGMVRWLADRWTSERKEGAEAETTPGVLLCSGLIAGGTIAGVLIAFSEFLPPDFKKMLSLATIYGPMVLDEDGKPKLSDTTLLRMDVAACFMFTWLVALILYVERFARPKPASAPPPSN
jgi:putative OPT family oligopeptide transporter